MKDKRDDPLRPEKRRLTISLILLLGSVIYAIFPVDIIPDLLGPIGWVDDIGFLLSACLNSAYSYYLLKKKTQKGSER
jgi:uncharacterized membrane protein YkvA (DUF1232 family)